MPGRPIWKGAISFGLVNIPVKLASAVSEKEVRFHMLHAADKARIRMKRYCSAEDREVAYEEIERGYEVAPDQYVVLAEEELAAAAPEAARTIDLIDFVEIAEIDPAFFDHPYYLVPEKNATKAYGLLHAALTKSGRVGIGRVVLRTKEYLVAVRPKDGVLVMETMRYPDEIVPAEAAFGEVAVPTRAEGGRELAVAERLVETLTTKFDAAKYHDRHRERLLALIEKKAEGEVVTPPKVERPSATKDLLKALEESLREARREKEKGAEAAA
ncbi:MAG: non-homologous end joining protein Ku [Methanobacteriota archaeon]